MMTGNASTGSVGMSAANEPKSPTPMGGASVSEVLARLESAEFVSRELDGAVMALSYQWEHRHIGATCWDDYHGKCCPDAKHLDWVWVDPATDKFVTNAFDGFEFTSSLDRALALAERVLPGWAWTVDRWGKMTRITLNECDAEGWHRSKHVRIEVAAEQPPALALCIAILRARQASNPTAEGK